MIIIIPLGGIGKRFSELGYNFEPSEISASFGKIQLQKEFCYIYRCVIT